MLYGKLPNRAQPGDWLRVSYSGHSLDQVEIKVGTSNWLTCYHDDGDVMIRVPRLRSGEYNVLIRQNKNEERSLGTLTVQGDSSGPSVNVTRR